MHNPNQNTIVELAPIPAVEASSTLTPVATLQPAPKVKRGVNWATFFQPRDWVRGPDGTPDEIKVKTLVKDKKTGVEEEKEVGTGRYRLKNLHIPGDTIVDGNGDSYMAMPDMSVRAITKYHRRQERAERRAAQKAQLKELRDAKRQSGGLTLTKRVLLGTPKSPA